MHSEEHADASDGGGEGAAERERAYLGCKPLAPAEATRVAEAAEAGGVSRLGRIFYGNDTAYIFFRLHYLLYDRCRCCLPCARAHSCVQIIPLCAFSLPGTECKVFARVNAEGACNFEPPGNSFPPPDVIASVCDLNLPWGALCQGCPSLSLLVGPLLDYRALCWTLGLVLSRRHCWPQGPFMQ